MLAVPSHLAALRECYQHDFARLRGRMVSVDKKKRAPANNRLIIDGVPVNVTVSSGRVQDATKLDSQVPIDFSMCVREEQLSVKMAKKKCRVFRRRPFFGIA